MMMEKSMLSKQIMKDEMLCTSREEHIALFVDFDDDSDEDDDF